MNTEQELREACNDYERTEFGDWPWPRLDMVHGKQQLRFSCQGGRSYVYPDSDVTLDK
jgi:hypothetical protein